MIVLGDSHVRAYGLNTFFTPIFLGPGKEVNFIDWHNVDQMLLRFKRVEDIFSPESILLCLGEPDTRYAMGCGWTPWCSSRQKDNENYKFLEKCSQRYLTLVRELEDNLNWSVYIQNIILTRDPTQCCYIDFYNAQLKSGLGEKFLSFNENLRGPDGTINEEFSWDMIHANNRICRFVEAHFGFNGVDYELIANTDMMAHMKKNEKFNVLQFSGKSRGGPPSLFSDALVRISRWFR